MREAKLNGAAHQPTSRSVASLCISTVCTEVCQEQSCRCRLLGNVIHQQDVGTPLPVPAARGECAEPCQALIRRLSTRSASAVQGLAPWLTLPPSLFLR